MGSVALEGFGSGGATLNFKVVPGLTQPGTASENTIWLETDNITGWYFSATKPNSMENGEVWFPIGTESAVEFNALKKNGIMVYPQSAKKMVSGALVDLEAMIYQGGKWIAWTRYLYEKGNHHTDITGGWKGSASIASSGTVTLGGSDGIGDTFYTAKKISKGKETKLYANIPSVTRSGGNVSLILSKVNSSAEAAGDEANMFGYIDITAKGTHSIPLTGITEPFYVYMYTYNSITATIDSIWMK